MIRTFFIDIKDEEKVLHWCKKEGYAEELKPCKKWTIRSIKIYYGLHSYRYTEFESYNITFEEFLQQIKDKS